MESVTPPEDGRLQQRSPKQETIKSPSTKKQKAAKASARFKRKKERVSKEAVWERYSMPNITILIKKAIPLKKPLKGLKKRAMFPADQAK